MRNSYKKSFKIKDNLMSDDLKKNLKSIDFSTSKGLEKFIGKYQEYIQNNE